MKCPKEIVLKSLRAMKNWSRSKPKSYPYIARVGNLIQQECLFELSCPVEEYRVLTLDGEEEFIRLLLNKVRKGDVFFDVGSCIGVFTIPVALLGAQVVAFEPDPNLRIRFLRNLSLNGLGGGAIQLADWAVADAPGESVFYTEGVNGRSGALRAVDRRAKILVETDSIDNAIKDDRLPSPNLIKMDIEGAEILALRGMSSLLSSAHAPRSIFIEIHTEFLVNFGSSAEECMTLLESAGYVQECIQPRSGQIHCIYSKPSVGVGLI